MIIYVKPGRNKRPVYIIADGQDPNTIESDTEKTVKQLIDASITVFKGIIILTGSLAIIGFITITLFIF